jgi:hypothetical protein
MLRSRSAWLRVLRLYRLDGEAPPADLLDDPLLDARVHACSRFQSLQDPARRALYSVHDAGAGAGGWLTLRPPAGRREGVEHTLIAVREFRRIPLDASSLALTLFAARPGRAVAVVAALAHFVERAVDAYRPGYLLLAHSLEEPGRSLLLTAAQDTHGFSLAELRPELDLLLESPPERYAYAPESQPAPTGAILPV